MKLRTLLTTLLLLIAGAASAAITSGYYHILSYNGKYMTENISDHTLVCSDLATPTNYAQVWYITVSGSSVTFKNALTNRYILFSNSAYTTNTTQKTSFTANESSGVYTFANQSGAGLHCDNANFVVFYYTNEAKSKWTLESTTVNSTELTNQQTALTEANTSQLQAVFTDLSCSALKSGYTNSAVNALPASTQALVTKIKNNTWTTYSGWTKTEKTFRIADYKAYSDHDRWKEIFGFTNYTMGRLSNPTGIWVNSGDIIQVYVGTIPSGQSVKLEVADYQQASGTTYALHEGMNSLLIASKGNCFVNYEVDNTTNGQTPYKLMSTYADVTVHIEGGTVQGYFDLTKGDTDTDWAQMKTHLLTDVSNRSNVCLKTDKHVFNLNITRLETSLGTGSLTEMLNVWRNVAQWEDELMGRSDNLDSNGGQTRYGQYCNTLFSVTMTTDGYAHASNHGTFYPAFYDDNIYNASNLLGVADDMWCIAHEQGHNRQSPINMAGNTEISNNLFSNVAIYKQGRFTSRTASIQEVFRDFADGLSWPERVAKSCDSYGNYNQQMLHLNWSLYLYFHVLGKDPDFFPRLFDALRADPMTKVKSGSADNSTLTPASTDYLKYYVKCCEVSGYDLTEFFATYGFFILPAERDYSITYNNVTTNRFATLNDYGYYYLYATQDMIDNAKAQVANMNLPKCNITFIEDRVTAPDATYEGAPSGTKRTINPDAPVSAFGQVGETGQYTDFDAECSAYKYNVKNNAVTMEGTGAVGFKVYDSEGNLRGVYNTYHFTLPNDIGTGYTIKAAAGNGTDAAATFDANVGIITSDVTDVLSAGAKVTAESQLISGKLYLLRNTATGNPWITDAGTYYSVGNNGGTFDERCMYYLIKDGDTWKIKNYVTGKYWGKPTAASTTNQGGFVPTDEANAGSWSLNFNNNGNIDPQCNGFYINRASQKLHAWNASLSSQIYEVILTYPPFSDFTNKDISVSTEAAASLETGKWYAMFDRGANHGYLYENNQNKLYNTNTVPSGSATNNAKYLVRIVGWDNEYYLQTGLGNFFGNIQGSTTVPTTATATEQITIKKIAGTDGHFYLMSAAGVVLDANDTRNGDATVVGWGTTAPTATGGNNDWAFYPVEFVDAWVPTASDVYTINNTNSGRGALTYEPNKSTTYVWSSGKSGATAFDATNQNHQWVIIPTGTAGQYYLYNVGAGKFAIPTGIAQSADLSWVFSDNAVAVIFEDQSDGTKKIKMASNPVNGTNAAYMAVSNNYTGPIINYNDVGGNFTITKVGGQDQSAAANAAVAKLVKNQTALTAAPTASGWYALQIKTAGNASYVNRYVKAADSEYNYNGTYYPLTFTGAVDIQPSIKDATFFTYIDMSSGAKWQMPNGKYLVNNSNKFPTSSSTANNITISSDNNGIYFKGGYYYAVPYNSGQNYFIGETSQAAKYYNVYPIDLSAASLTAWQVLCDNAPETAQITCSRSDVSGLTAVYKNGFFFLPTGVTPVSTDFNLEGATNVTVSATAKTVTFAYDPTLAIVADGVTVEQGWQTAGRGGEVMLLRVTAKPFKAATSTTLTVNLKDGSESNISALKLYEANSNSPEIYSTGDGAPTKTVVATTSISGSTATFNIGNLAAGTHYYWIGATVKSDATLGAVLDAAVTGISYQVAGQTAQALDLTSVGDPADRGAMVFNAQSYPFLPRDNSSRVYRIPAMIVADDGSIVVACDKRYNSHTDIGAGHVIDIVVRRSTDGGKTWSSPITIAKGLGTADDAKCGYGDPSLVKGKDGKLYCLFVAGNIGYFYGQKRIAMSTSTDNGVTWSSNESTPPIDLLESGRLKNYNTVGEAGYGLYDYFVTSGRGLYIPDDDILMYLIPAQTMTSATEHTSDSQDYIFYSRDGGESWYFSENPMVQGGDEAKIIQMNDGSLFGSIRKGGPRRFNTATYTKNDDGKTLSFNFGTQWENNQLYQSSQNNQDIFYYQRETTEGKTDVIIHSITTGNHANFKLYYSTDKGVNWTEFLNVQTKGTRYVTMDKNPANGSLYLFFEDQSLNSAGGYTDYNHYPLNFIEITRDQLVSLIPALEEYNVPEYLEAKDVKIVNGLSGESNFGSWSGLTWTSNAASGVAGLTMTLSDGAYNRFSNFNGRYNLAYHPAAANTNSTITLTAPEGYVITGYSVQTGVYQGTTYTLTASDGTSVTPANLGSTYTPLEVTGLSATSTTITVTTTDASKWLSLANFTVSLAKTLPLNVVGDKSYATLYLPFDVTTTGATKAYYIETASNRYAHLTATGNDGTEIPARTAVVLVNEDAEPSTILNMASDLTSVVSESANLLKGTLVPMSLDLSDGTPYYSMGRLNGEIGFYKYTDGTITLGANKAYLEVPASGGAKGYTLDFDDATGLKDLKGLKDSDDLIYNLSGQRMSKPVKGINIINGKKVLK
ncbi:MAG: exo-alpha-sialidase [Bacteroidaceae bacterium]|nr:exo-alpha-sialidase [Bacteroidaceae bacterium]